MNSFYKNKNITDYVKLILLGIMFLLSFVFKASTGDYILLIVLILIEFAFKIGFKYINSISYTISNKFYKNILNMLNIINFEFEFLFIYIFFDSIFEFNIKYLVGIIFGILVISIIFFSLFVSLNLKYEVLTFRMANESDRESILEIYLEGAEALKTDGVDQWQGQYVPSFKDIDEHLGIDLYVLEYHRKIVSTVCLVEGIDEDYENIKGKWNTSIPYISIHKVATSNKYKKQSFAKKMMSYIENLAKRKRMDLRIDTHKDNKKMRNFIMSCGYKYAGEVILQGELERLAYDKKVL
ncbi:GNAT family N-acetyltransferase [Parvimonas micra]|uniref:GNAT family N-acetyltransferase n=1 Tax=Parvimonas micra TaxID=33033 RepID=A0A9X3HC98_9FIRM|nr:GNAT family N-acetyltransferase [Parvimonas micra]MCZ7408099.1 GNAT family N-acetyltransferase [Parvimonas micra]MCZ7411241.1 GNAT family N-acetyltransferase [Parvimonas micra]MCZ7412840.1 GNAT family N-acetyltransferase [Parvimonas micra]WBB36918.1 GNAT family N-acetyltransferase [Parvimonas micra]